jgi:hypothetical protein
MIIYDTQVSEGFREADACKADRLVQGPGETYEAMAASSQSKKKNQ